MKKTKNLYKKRLQYQALNATQGGKINWGKILGAIGLTGGIGAIGGAGGIGIVEGIKTLFKKPEHDPKTIK